MLRQSKVRFKKGKGLGKASIGRKAMKMRHELEFPHLKGKTKSAHHGMYVVSCDFIGSLKCPYIKLNVGGEFMHMQ